VSIALRIFRFHPEGLCARKGTGLARESVVNVSQLITMDKRLLTGRVGRLSPATLRTVDAGIKRVLAL
jgi:mRNA interferase MazF